MNRSAFAILVVIAACCSRDKAASTTPAPVATEAEPPAPLPAPPLQGPEPPRPPPESEPEEPPVAATTPCDEYFAVIAEVEVQCVDKIPPAAMDAMRQGRDAMRAAFADWDKMDDASRQAANDAATQGCLAARDAILQVRESLGCAR